MTKGNGIPMSLLTSGCWVCRVVGFVLPRLKWRKRSSVKITGRTYEEGTEGFHARGKSNHPEAASFGQSA
jgi:hypothetical protein